MRPALHRGFCGALALGLTVGFVLIVSAARAAPDKVLWKRWAAHDPQSTALIDHRFWDHFLQKVVFQGPDGINRIDYGNVARPERLGLKTYIEFLAAVRVADYNRTEQLAYWINLYNALTVRVVIEHYPVDSIRDIDISPGLFADGPWGRKLIEVDGVPVSLDDIEHRILRPIWHDPRIHYAVNCASLGCPNLQPTAFNGFNVNALLETAARDFVNHPRGVALIGGELTVSRIYDWFKVDFGGNDKAVLAHLRRYADPLRQRMLVGRREIGGYRYDWRLNGIRR